MKKNKHGGTRPGAGRKPNSGIYKEPTVVMRVPASAVAAIREWLSAMYGAEEPGESKK